MLTSIPHVFLAVATTLTRQTTGGLLGPGPNNIRILSRRLDAHIAADWGTSSAKS